MAAVALDTDSNNPPSDNKLEAVSALLTLFDLQDELSGQDNSSALINAQTLLTKAIQDSCNYVRKLNLACKIYTININSLITRLFFGLFQINVTLHDTFTTDRDVNCTDPDTDHDIRFMRQTFECTREAARELQTKLELLILIRSAESRVLSLPDFDATPDYYAWIERGNFSDNARQYLRCVADSIW